MIGEILRSLKLNAFCYIYVSYNNVIRNLKRGTSQVVFFVNTVFAMDIS